MVPVPVISFSEVPVTEEEEDSMVPVASICLSEVPETSTCPVPNVPDPERITSAVEPTVAS